MSDKQPISEYGHLRKPVGKKKLSGGTLWGIVVVIFWIVRILAHSEDTSRDRFGNIKFNEVSGPESEAAVAQLLKQEYTKDTYRSLLSGLTGKPDWSSKETGVTDTVVIRQPKGKGEDPFAVVNDSISLYTSAYMVNSLKVVNNSEWSAIALYMLGDGDICSAYIPAHQTVRIRYGSDLGLNILLGKEWNSKHMTTFYRSSRAAGAELKQAVAVKGFFRTIAASTRNMDTESYLISCSSGGEAFPYDAYIQIDDKDGDAVCQVLQEGATAAK